MASALCIYYVYSANIAINGAGFSLYKITWQNPPPSTQSVLVQYRKQGDVTWINASTNLQVDIYGNIVIGSFNILAVAESGITYEVRLVNQCGSLEYIQSILYTAKINAGTYLIGYAAYNICGNYPEILFSNIPFTIGAFMFTDVGLAVPLTGYSLIAEQGSGRIYTINAGTGEVLTLTAYNCNSTYKTAAKLNTVLGSICGGAIIDIYTSQPLGVGTFLFTDQALSIPVTTSTYLLDTGTGIIYNITYISP